MEITQLITPQLAICLILAVIGLTVVIALLATIAISLQHEKREVQIQAMTISTESLRISWDLEVALHQLEVVKREHGVSIPPFCPRQFRSKRHG